MKARGLFRLTPAELAARWWAIERELENARETGEDPLTTDPVEGPREQERIVRILGVFPGELQPERWELVRVEGSERSVRLEVLRWMNLHADHARWNDERAMPDGGQLWSLRCVMPAAGRDRAMAELLAIVGPWLSTGLVEVDVALHRLVPAARLYPATWPAPKEKRR